MVIVVGERRLWLVGKGWPLREGDEHGWCAEGEA